MLVLGHAGIAECAHEDPVDVIPKVVENVVGKGLPGFQIMGSTQFEVLPLERRLVERGSAIDSRKCGLNDLRTDPVTANRREPESSSQGIRSLSTRMDSAGLRTPHRSATRVRARPHKPYKLGCAPNDRRKGNR